MTGIVLLIVIVLVLFVRARSRGDDSFTNGYLRSIDFPDERVEVQRHDKEEWEQFIITTDDIPASKQK